MIIAEFRRRDIGAEGQEEVLREGHTEQSICKLAEEKRFRVVIKPSKGRYYYLKGKDMTIDEAIDLLRSGSAYKIIKSEKKRAYVLDW